MASLPVVDPETGSLVGIITESDIFAALIEIMGVQEKGTRLSLDLEHKPGILAGVTEIVKNHKANIISVVSCPSERRDDRRTVVMRLDSEDVTAIVRELEEKGYGVSTTYDEPKGRA